MKALKGILIGLVVTLVIIIAAGGALIGFNHEGHETGDGTQVATNSKNTTETTEGHQNQQNQQNEQKNNVGKEKVVVAKEQLPPEEYLKKIQEAQALIKEATGLMANDAYMGENTAAGNSSDSGTDNKSNSSNANASEMDKMHQGIYKMAQGMTMMDLAVGEMEKGIKEAKGSNTNFYTIPINPAPNYYYNPYVNGYYQSPYGYNPNPNGNNSQNITNDPNSQNDQDPNSHTNMQNGATHNTSSLGTIFNGQTIVYGIYGFLVISLLGVFVAIFGFIKGLFKTNSVQE